MALGLDLHDFEVGDRGLKFWVPIDEALVLVDQAFPIKLDENLDDGPRKPVVQGKALARPIAGGAEPLQLLDDRPAGLGFPFPHARQKLLTPQGDPAGFLTLHQLPLDDHLRGDAGVIRAGLPKHVLAAHPLEAAENVLQGRVERVAHVQGAGDVRRRNDDRERRRPCPLRAPCPERARLLPCRRDTAFDRLWIESLFHHWIVVPLSLARPWRASRGRPRQM